MLTQPLIDKYFGNGPCGNGLRWMSEYVLGRGRKLTPEEKHLFNNAVYACMKEPGLLKRGPWPVSDQEAHDDYTAVISACVYCSLDTINQRIYEYGLEHNGVYDNSNEGKREAHIWRMRQVQAHMEWAVIEKVGKTPPLWRRIYWSIVIATSGKPPKVGATEFDTWALAWHLVNVWKIKCKNPYWFETWATSNFIERFKKQWPNLMEDVSWAYSEGVDNNENA